MYFNSKIKKIFKIAYYKCSSNKSKQHCERRRTECFYFLGEFNFKLRAKSIDFAALTELLSLAATAALRLYFANFSNTVQ